MKKLILLLSILNLFSCKPKAKESIESTIEVPPGYRYETINLINGIGKIFMLVPDELDTFFSWTNSSDYQCGDKKMYRFANSKMQIFQETGYLFTTKVDSFTYLTVSHRKWPQCKDEYGIRSEEFIKRIKDQCGDCISQENYRKLNGREFYVTDKNVYLNDNKNPETFLTLITGFDSVNIKIVYYCYAKNCDDFFRKVNKSFELIRIENK